MSIEEKIATLSEAEKVKIAAILTQAAMAHCQKEYKHGVALGELSEITDKTYLTFKILLEKICNE